MHLRNIVFIVCLANFWRSQYRWNFTWTRNFVVRLLPSELFQLNNCRCNSILHILHNSWRKPAVNKFFSLLQLWIRALSPKVCLLDALEEACGIRQRDVRFVVENSWNCNNGTTCICQLDCCSYQSQSPWPHTPVSFVVQILPLCPKCRRDIFWCWWTMGRPSWFSRISRNYRCTARHTKQA